MPTLRAARPAGRRGIMGRMAASDAGPLIAAAAIGAGGSVLTQVVGLVFTGRRDTKRLRWERGKQQREWEIGRSERFLDLKRQLYGDYLVQVDQLLSYINWEDEFRSAPRPDEPPDTERLRRIQENIGLVAPRSLFTKVQAASAALTGVVWDVAAGATPEEVRPQTAEARRALDAMRRDMRSDLRGEEDRYFEPANRAKVEKVPPDPPPAHALPWWRRATRPLR